MIDAVGRTEAVGPAGTEDPTFTVGKAVTAGPRHDNKPKNDLTAAPTLEDLKQAAEVLEETVQAFNLRLSFILHEDSGRMQVRVIDNITSEVVKEIPPTEILEVAARIRKMVGVLLDEKV